MQALAHLHDSITELSEMDLPVFNVNDFSELIVELEKEKARFAAAEARILQTFDTERLFRTDGSRSAASWLTSNTDISPSTARRLCREARRLARMDHTRLAFGLGQIHADHVSVLCGLAGSPRTRVREAFQRDEETLVGSAKTLQFDKFMNVIAYWKLGADPDGAYKEAKECHDDRHLYLAQTLGGSWYLKGGLDPINGEIVANALAAIDDEFFEADWKAAKAIHGDNVTVDELARTPAQRRADALVELATRAQTAPADGQRPRPLVSFYIGYETATGYLSELASGAVVPPSSVLAYLTEADIERSVWAPGNRGIELSHTAPFFTGGLRRLIELRDRHCQHPACNVPAARCEADHDRPRSKGGPTTQENGRLLCKPHNRHKSDKYPYSDDDP